MSTGTAKPFHIGHLGPLFETLAFLGFVRHFFGRKGCLASPLLAKDHLTFFREFPSCALAIPDEFGKPFQIRLDHPLFLETFPPPDPNSGNGNRGVAQLG